MGKDRLLVHGQKVAFGHLFKALPETFKKIIDFFMEQNRSLTLVGGTVRDYLSFEKVGFTCDDWDFEVRNVKESHLNPREDLLKIRGRLPDEFVALMEQRDIRETFLIFKFREGNSTLEIGPPRIEKYAIGEAFHHRDFKADFTYAIDYKDAFLRRDFTVNAMGLALLSMSEAIFIDPFAGYRDLVKKELTPCGPDFLKDPVRFLRALRFRITLPEMKWSAELEKVAANFNLTYLTPEQFLKEAFRSEAFFTFNRSFWEEVRKSCLFINEALAPLELLDHSTLKIFDYIANVDELLVFIVGLKKVGFLDSTEMEGLTEFLKAGNKKPLGLNQLWGNLIQVSLMDSMFRLQLIDTPVEELKTTPGIWEGLVILSDWINSFQQWYSYLPALNRIMEGTLKATELFPGIGDRWSNIKTFYGGELLGEIGFKEFQKTPFASTIPATELKYYRSFYHMLALWEQPDDFEGID